MKRTYSILLMALVLAVFGLARTPNSAYAATCTWTGNTDTAWETTGNWTNCQGTGSSAPANNDTVIIPDVTNDPVVNTAATTGLDVTIQSGGLLKNSSSGAIAFNNFTIDGGGKYIHDRAAILPGSTSRSFAATSTIEFLRNSPNTCPVSVTYGNLIINISNFTSNVGCSENLASIAGDLEIKNTSGFELRFVNTQNTTHSISGNLIIDGGTLVFSSGTGAPPVNVTGSLNITSGTLNLASSSGAPTLNIGGNFSQSGGTFTSTGAGVPSVSFTGGSSSVAFTQSAGTFTSTNMNFTVASGKTLTLNNNIPIASSRTLTVAGGATLNTGTNVVSGAGTFTLASGGTLGIGSAAGITTGASGNIQTTTRNFNTSANYTYNGTVAQATGNALPAMVNNLTISNSGGTVTLTNASVTVSNNMTVNSGSTFDANGNSITVTVTLENDGTLRQTLAVNGTGTVDFFNTGSYGGAVLDAAGGGDLGSTLVVIRGNRACDTANSMIRRCYDIQPTNTSGRSATVKLAYYTTPDDEENGLTCATLDLFHHTGTAWVVAGNTPTRSCGGTTRTVQKVGVASFSPFGMSGPAGPTAVTLLSFTALPAGQPLLPLASVALTALIGLSGLGLTRMRAARPGQ